MTSAVSNGRLNYVSPSAIKTFDRRHDGGCARKWGFRYISKIVAPPTKAQEIGTAGHERIEHYLKTGEDVLTDIERAGALWIPTPKSELIIEPAIDNKSPIAVLAGVPLIGRLDCVDGSAVYVDPEGNQFARDVPEILDWKFSSDPRKWGLTADQIVQDLAMNSYAVWLSNRASISQVRLSLVYFATKKRDAVKRTARKTVSDCLQVVRSYEPTVAAMKSAATCTDPNLLEPNYDACNSYGGCPYQVQCNRSTDVVLSALFQKMEGKEMGIADQLAKLEANEKAAGEKREIAALLAKIAGYNMGAPAYSGPIAAAEAERLGHTLTAGAGIGGHGTLGGISEPIRDIVKLRELVKELDAYHGTTVEPAEAPAAILPESTPPTLAESAQVIPPEERLTLSPPVQAAANEHAEAVIAATPANADAPAAPAEPPKKKGRPASNPSRESELLRMKKADLAALVLQLESSTPEPEMREVNHKAKAFVDDPGLQVWVDCLPNATPGMQSLDPYIEGLCQEVAKAGKAVHMLSPPDDSPLAYGKWRGYLQLAVKQHPPAPGCYHVRAKGDEVKEAVVSALGSLATVHRGF